MEEGLGLSPISTERKKLSDQVFASLCEAIVKGTLPPGERLPEARLARALSVSRMPVREALAKLERRNLVYRDAAGTCVVARWDKQMLWEVATLRGALEGLVVRLAIDNLTVEDLDSLETIIHRMERAVRRNDHERLIQLDIEFHNCIWSRTGHKLLQETLEEIKPQVHYFMYLTRPGDEEGYPETHQEIVDVLRAGDTERAQAVIQEHTLMTAQRAIARLELEPVKP
ncbi:MAG: GntR family transcriptional regulator [Anaerolineae bacterium]|jgi:DNA-binding GntR family transcriptional regulator